MKDFAYLFKMFVNCIVKHCVFDKKCVQGNSLFGSSKQELSHEGVCSICLKYL